MPSCYRKLETAVNVSGSLKLSNSDFFFSGWHPGLLVNCGRFCFGFGHFKIFMLPAFKYKRTC